jgi:hypothetical protein
VCGRLLLYDRHAYKAGVADLLIEQQPVTHSQLKHGRWSALHNCFTFLRGA